jgi:hypothetical protein
MIDFFVINPDDLFCNQVLVGKGMDITCRSAPVDL